MRRIVIAVWLGTTSLVAAAPAVAESLITLPPLAPGEVLLETGGSAVVHTPATRATLTVSVYVSGKTPEEAEQAMGAAVARVRAAARAAGARAEDVVIFPHSSDMGMLMNASMSLNYSGVGEDMSGAQTDHYSIGRAQIALSQPQNAQRLAEALAGIDGVGIEETLYSLDDRRPSRRAARAQAIEHARADAEAYAAAMNMRIARVLRVSDRDSGALDMIGDPDVRTAMLDASVRGGSVESQVVTHATVRVDYAMMPR